MNSDSLTIPIRRPRSRGIFEHLTSATTPLSSSDLFSAEAANDESGEGMPDKLDIVLTHYSEDTMEETVTWWSGFLDIEKVAELKPRVFVYCQNPLLANRSSAAFKPLLRYGGKVANLDNLGREGHAYLIHITEHYDQLPQHILFSQDIPVDTKLWHRFQKMFEPSTGFLPLAHVGHQSCDDPWLPSRLMQQVYSMLAKKVCPPEGFTTSYEGQFLVSRTRVRGVDWWTYQNLLDLLSAPAEHWIHESHDINTLKKPDNPVFGHVVERAWSVAYNCYEPWRQHNCWECDKRKNMDDCGRDACQCYDS